MWMLVMLLCGFQEAEDFVMDIRGYEYYVSSKPVAGSRRLLILNDIPNDATNRVNSKNTVVISVDDLGMVIPVGLTIKVTGNKRTIDFGGGNSVEGVWVNRREQIKIVGLAKELIPPLTAQEKAKFYSPTEADFLRGKLPVPKKKTGVGTGIEFPGGKQ
jgi:hypothetical protein